MSVRYTHVAHRLQPQAGLAQAPVSGRNNPNPSAALKARAPGANDHLKRQAEGR